MPEITTQVVKDYLVGIQGQVVTLDQIRKELGISRYNPNGAFNKSFDSIRNIMFQLAEGRIVKPTGKRSGEYKVVTQVEPVRVFLPNREKRPPFELIFPRDFDSMMEIGSSGEEGSTPFNAVLREGDLILISGLSNFGKTTLCIRFCGENIDKRPVLMGNEYTQLVPDKEDATKSIYIPAPRFLNRLEGMDEIEWTDGDGNDKFTLLPVRDDYADHIIKDRINIIDWINIDTGEHYMIGTILEGIKRNLGRGIAIVAIQKAEGAAAGRGGQFTKDFADLELLIDRFGTSDVLLTIGKVKEYTKPIIGKTFAYAITHGGVRIQNFREVKRCIECHGQGFVKGGGACELCHGNKYVDC